jgi:O-antigen/teichoic acid export membrane protein
VLIAAWVGPKFHATVPVLRVLAALVVIRSWTAIPSTVLKGTGHHHYLAMTSAQCAVATLLLSIPAVKLFGMVGVAWGMTVPVGVVAAACIFPRACRVVGIPTARGYREIVWPAVWPGVVVVALLALTRHAVPPSPIPVLADFALGGLVYAALFLLCALPRNEREWFGRTINQLAGRRAAGLWLRARKSEV